MTTFGTTNFGTTASGTTVAGGDLDALEDVGLTGRFGSGPLEVDGGRRGLLVADAGLLVPDAGQLVPGIGQLVPDAGQLVAGPARAARGPADRFARWAFRVREPNGEPDVHNIFSSSIFLSATRCLLSYIVLPVLAPWIGTVPLIGPAIGLPIGLVALVFDVRAMRRFFQADHRWRWVAAALYLAVMAMVTALVFRDISRLATELA